MQDNVSNGELIDKLTILQIKQEKGLSVSAELDHITFAVCPLFEETPHLSHALEVLKSINSQLWVIEDSKRACEKTLTFDRDFIALSRLVYMLNDERARVKKMIDALTGSAFSEQKSHSTI